MAASDLESVYGINAVGDVLRHNPRGVTALYIAAERKDRRIQALVERAISCDITVSEIERGELEAMLDAAQMPPPRHQGVLALCRPTPARDEDFLQSLLARSERPLLLLLLDGVTDPHNLGACLRSADAAGAQAVLVPKDNAVGLTPVVRKVASGAAETTPLVVVKNMARCIKNLQQQGVWVMGAAGESDGPLFDMDFTVDTAIVMGAEGSGLRQLTRQRCDQLFSIPMRGAVESLNVSVAAGICLFEVLRQRRGG